MLIRDKLKLLETSEVIFDEKEGKFIFKDARQRTVAKLGLPNPRDAQLIEYTIQLMTHRFRIHGYVDIYRLNDSVEAYSRGEEVIEETLLFTTMPAPQITVEPPIETSTSAEHNVKFLPKRTVSTPPSELESVVHHLEETVDDAISQHTTFVHTPDKIVTTEEITNPIPTLKETATAGIPQDIAEHLHINTECEPESKHLEVNATPIEPTFAISDTEVVRPKQTLAGYLGSFLIDTANCTEIEDFKNQIIMGRILGVPKDRIAKELSFLPKDALFNFAHSLHATFSPTSTQSDLAYSILNTLKY